MSFGIFCILYYELLLNVRLNDPYNGLLKPIYTKKVTQLGLAHVLMKKEYFKKRTHSLPFIDEFTALTLW